MKTCRYPQPYPQISWLSPCGSTRQSMSQSSYRGPMSHRFRREGLNATSVRVSSSGARTTLDGTRARGAMLLCLSRRGSRVRVPSTPPIKSTGCSSFVATRFSSLSGVGTAVGTVGRSSARATSTALTIAERTSGAVHLGSRTLPTRLFVPRKRLSRSISRGSA